MDCRNCGEAFDKNQSHQKYCSKRCKRSYEAKNRVYTDKEKAEGKIRARRLYVKKNYGMSWDDYLAFIASGICEICGKTEQENGRVLCVDHGHSTRLVRGLLCDDCNRGLGFFKDDIDLLAKAISYLRSVD